MSALIFTIDLIQDGRLPGIIREASVLKEEVPSWFTPKQSTTVRLIFGVSTKLDEKARSDEV